jgi:DNA-binding response OmpR family regulator
MKKVLVLEDESSIRSFVVINLRRSGYEPIEAGTGAEALEKLKMNPDICLALLDVMLPDIDGFEVCRRIRASGSHMGIIMLTAKSQEIDKVTGLMTGADDYVTKPFSPAELTARVDALVRSAGSRRGRQKILRARQRAVHPEHPQPHAGKGRQAPAPDSDRVPADEAVYGQSRQGHVAREDILREVWGRDYFGELKIVDVNIRRLRLKIEDNVQNPTYITTVWGYGYKWGF